MSVDEQELMENPAVSYWLKTAITNTKERDIVDALNDAELLLAILNARFSNVKE
jgi:hypothetical protein